MPSLRPTVVVPATAVLTFGLAPAAAGAAGPPPREISNPGAAGYYRGLDYPDPATLRATITVPTVTCAPGDRTLYARAALLGIVVDSRSEASGRLEIACVAGTPRYTASAGVSEAPDGATLAVRPGDTLGVAVSSGDRGAFARLTLQRTGQTSTASGADIRVSGAAFEIDASVAPAFTAVRYENVTVNGTALGARQTSRETQVSREDGTIAQPGPLTDGGRGFRVFDRR